MTIIMGICLINLGCIDTHEYSPTNTAKILILFRLRYRPVTVPLPSRYRYTVTVIDRRPPIPYRY